MPVPSRVLGAQAKCSGLPRRCEASGQTTAPNFTVALPEVRAAVTPEPVGGCTTGAGRPGPARGSPSPAGPNRAAPMVETGQMARGGVVDRPEPGPDGSLLYPLRPQWPEAAMAGGRPSTWSPTAGRNDGRGRVQQRQGPGHGLLAVARPASRPSPTSTSTWAPSSAEYRLCHATTPVSSSCRWPPGLTPKRGDDDPFAERRGVLAEVTENGVGLPELDVVLSRPFGLLHRPGSGTGMHCSREGERLGAFQAQRGA